MIPTVKDVCQIHPMALNYAIVEQIENLSNVIEHTAEDARAFFAKKPHYPRDGSVAASGAQTAGRSLRPSGV